MTRPSPAEPAPDAGDIFDMPSPVGTVGLAALDAEGNEVAFLRLRRDQYSRAVLAWMYATFGAAMRPTSTLKVLR
jgi:hypothetical protein